MPAIQLVAAGVSVDEGPLLARLSRPPRAAKTRPRKTVSFEAPRTARPPISAATTSVARRRLWSSPFGLVTGAESRSQKCIARSMTSGPESSGRTPSKLFVLKLSTIGKKISEVTPRRNRGQIRELRGRLLREKRLKGVTLRTVDAKGKEIVLEVAASLMVRRGKAPGALGIARDVTDRTKLEEKVRESKDYLELLVESSVDGIIATER